MVFAVAALLFQFSPVPKMVAASTGEPDNAYCHRQCDRWHAAKTRQCGGARRRDRHGGDGVRQGIYRSREVEFGR